MINQGGKPHVQILGYGPEKADKGTVDALTTQMAEKASKTDVSDLQNKMSDANRQSQVLQHGLSVINASMDSPVDIEIQGRTLISLGSSVLDAAKNYVLAAKHTKVKWADASTVQGVAKFVGKTEKPALIRIGTFLNKVSGSTTENPHQIKWSNAASLITPGSGSEDTQTGYDKMKSLDGNTNQGGPININGFMAQKLFSFDIISEIERNLGRIPKATLADKVQWLKDNIKSFTFNWYGYGSSVGGKKSNVTWWNASTSAWAGPLIHSNSIITKITLPIIGSAINAIDPNGIVNCLAYAEASDGTTASTISTDYVELEIELKQGANLHDPIVPLYEVDATEYGNILVAWDETAVLNRYPKVQGVQHLQNPYVMTEGENLLPPFTDPAWTISSNHLVVSTYKMTSNGSPGISAYTVNVVKNTDYFLDIGSDDAQRRLGVFDADTNASIVGYSYIRKTSFNTGSSTRVRVEFRSEAVATTYENPRLLLGTESDKLFVPRNPSYLFASVKLGQIGTTKDVLYKQDGQWMQRKAIEKDVVLDGSLGWTLHADHSGMKRLTFPLPTGFSNSAAPGGKTLTKYNGLTLKDVGGSGSVIDVIDSYGVDTGGARLSIGVADIDTGFGETYSPVTDELKAYFNGWQAKTVDVNGKPTAWRSLGDGTDAPTQTLAYVSANKAPNFTPYKLSYVLAAPNIQTVAVEGDIAVNGPTQVEVGSGVIVREKVTPAYNGSSSDPKYHINHSLYGGDLKLSPIKIINVYRNGVIDTRWTIIYNNGEKKGKGRAEIKGLDYDTTAEYTVTYLLMDRHLSTVNGLEIKASYDTSLKSVVDTLVERQADINTITSINVQAIAELYKRIKALGG